MCSPQGEEELPPTAGVQADPPSRALSGDGGLIFTSPPSPLAQREASPPTLTQSGLTQGAVEDLFTVPQPATEVVIGIPRRTTRETAGKHTNVHRLPKPVAKEVVPEFGSSSL